MSIRKFLVLLVAIIGGPIMLISGTGRLMAARATASWPTVEGQLLASEIEEKTTQRRFRSSTRYLPRARYQYDVDGRSFSCETVTRQSGGMGSGDRAEVESWLAALRKQPSVTVSYDPDEPAIAVLVAGSRGADWLAPLTGLGLIALAGGTIWSIVKAARNGELVEL